MVERQWQGVWVVGLQPEVEWVEVERSCHTIYSLALRIVLLLSSGLPLRIASLIRA